MNKHIILMACALGACMSTAQPAAAGMDGRKKEETRIYKLIINGDYSELSTLFRIASYTDDSMASCEAFLLLEKIAKQDINKEASDKTIEELLKFARRPPCLRAIRAIQVLSPLATENIEKAKKGFLEICADAYLDDDTLEAAHLYLRLNLAKDDETIEKMISLLTNGDIHQSVRLMSMLFLACAINKTKKRNTRRKVMRAIRSCLDDSNERVKASATYYYFREKRNTTRHPASPPAQAGAGAGAGAGSS